MRNTYDDFKRYMDVFNKCGELCNKQGMKFGYHNHSFEFSEKLNGEKLFDIMMKSMDPNWLWCSWIWGIFIMEEL